MSDAMTFANVMAEIDMHGLPTCYKQDNKLKKIMWGFLLFCAGILLSVSVYMCIWQFHDNPIITTWEYHLAEDKDFPNIRLCPMNWAHAGRLKDANPAVIEAVHYFWQLNSGTLSTVGAQDDQQLSEQTSDNLLYKFAFSEITKIKNVDESVKATAFSVSEFIKKCYNRTELFNCSDIISPILDIDYGVCYDITIPWKQTYGQDRHSLLLLININRCNIPSKFRAFNEGTRVFLQPPHSSVIIPIQHILISPGLHASVTFEEKKNNFLPSRSGSIGNRHSCKPTDGHQINKSNDNKSFETILKTADNTYLDCTFNCELVSMFERCGCIDFVDSKFLVPRIVNGNNSYCTSAALKVCQDVTESQSRSRMNCRKGCAHPCQMTSYVEHTAFSQLSPEFFQMNFGNIDFESSSNQKTTDNVDHRRQKIEHTTKETVNDYIILELGYYSVGTIEMKESWSMTFTTLTSNVGGQLGLWIGASVFTIAQLLIYCFSIIISRFSGNTSKPPPPENEQTINELTECVSVRDCKVIEC